MVLVALLLRREVFLCDCGEESTISLVVVGGGAVVEEEGGGGGGSRREGGDNVNDVEGRFKRIGLIGVTRGDGDGVERGCAE
jgi:hypothetical protein